MVMLTFVQAGATGNFWGFEDERSAYHGKIWEVPITSVALNPYATAVDRILAAFEETTGKSLQPDTNQRAGLKVYTNSGTGLSTPHDLTRAVINALVERGFEREQLFILDSREAMLRESGYLPPLSEIQVVGPFFEGVRVYSLDSKELISPRWFYDSPLPQEFTSPLGRQLLRQTTEVDPVEARKSYLPDKLMTNVDFWINLPMLINHPATAVAGSLVNASLWNVTNGNRFFNSPANAPVAIAEIASIPELLDTWALSILTLEEYQFIGGPQYNALYTRSQPRIWASIDPVILDANALRLLNAARDETGFSLLPEIPDSLDYAMQLNLGYGIIEQTEWLRLP